MFKVTGSIIRVKDVEVDDEHCNSVSPIKVEELKRLL